MPDADLAALRLDDPAGQVEGGERRAGQDQVGEDLEQLLVALGVLVEDAMGRLVGEGRHLGTRHGPGERRPELACEPAPVGSGLAA